MGTAELSLKKGNFVIVEHCFKANKNDCTVFHIDELSPERVEVIRMKKENLTFSKRQAFLITDENETVLLKNELPQSKTLGDTSRDQTKFVFDSFDFSRRNLL